MPRFAVRIQKASVPSLRGASLVILVAGLTAFFAGWVFLERLSDSATHLAIDFAGTTSRLQQHIVDQELDLSLGEARWAQVHSAAFVVVWGLIGFALLRVVGQRKWKSGPLSKPAYRNGVPLLPVAAAAFGVVEKMLALVALRADGASLRFVSGLGYVILTLSWTKWVLTALTVLLVIAMWVSAATAATQAIRRPTILAPFRRRSVHAATPAHVTSNGDGERNSGDSLDSAGRSDSAHPLDGVGVCCSGGGIRAAGFALGALSALELHPDPEGSLKDSVLGSAKYLASVSGGGYAASAWRIAAGTDPELPDRPVLGDPQDFKPEPNPFPSSTSAAPNLIEHIRDRRLFLATGRGGLPLAAIWFSMQTAWHLSLLFASVFVVAWPFGHLLTAWPVRALEVVTPETDPSRIEFALGTHQWVPPMLLVGCALALCTVRLLFEPSQRRRSLDGVIAAVFALAAALALILVVLPYLVDLVIEVIPNGVGQKFALSGLYAAGVATLWHLVARKLERSAKYLGGVLLGIGLFCFALYVVEHSALSRGWLSPPWVWGLVVFGLLNAFVLTNPDHWSLHDFYRRRLSGTFVSTVDDKGQRIPLRDADAATPLSGYRDAGGPIPVLCCAAARDAHTVTGVGALSMTMEPDIVTLHNWKHTEGSDVPVPWEQQISHSEYVARIPPGKRRQGLASVMGAAAISGAAIAPAMGRKSLKSTNALLAAFNARLGVWVPNPAYRTDSAAVDEPTRFHSPRLINMFKEILGLYEPEVDPNVYATDGGHWENLGLVELIRRRCEVIISIDASGDVPGTYKAFKDAMGLAETECQATVHIPAEEWERLKPGEDGHVPNNYVVGTIDYGHGDIGTLLYVKAVVAVDSPAPIRRYAAADPTFPNYSTGDQLLTDPQLTHLVRLGFDAMGNALRAHPAVTDAGLIHRRIQTR